jgi:nucleotide sugar dehydrogenase
VQICIVALGKIGLPLAVQFAQRGHEVIGADVDRRVVDLVNRGEVPFPGEAELDSRLREVVESKRLTATLDTTEAVSRSEAVVVVVPLLVDAAGTPDFRAMDAATDAIAKGLRPGTLVSYETTLPVHTTRERFTPRLAEVSGLRPGQDLFVCHSPERVFSGRIFADLRRYPKLVGGIDPESARRAVELYEAVLEFDERPDLDRPNGVWDLGSAEAAELAKLAETTYRDVNIALANEFARFADRVGIDVHAVIEASNSQPYSHVHSPGIAVGGHCIPVYPRFYLSGDPEARIPAVAREVNEGMPAYAVDALADAVGGLNGLRVVVLGLAYRGGVKETAFSGAMPVVEHLRRRGAVVTVHDPLYTDQEIRSYGFEPHQLGQGCDAAILQADHAEYLTLGADALPGVRALVDGRHVVDPRPWSAAGVEVITLGAGGRWRSDEP